MAIIEAYQCDITGKKFFIKEEYENHTRILKNKQKALSYTKLPKFLIEQKFFEMRNTCSTEEELNEWIAEHLWVFEAAMYSHPKFASKSNDTPDLKTIQNSCLIDFISVSSLKLDSRISRFNHTSRFSQLPSYDNEDALDKFQAGFSGKIQIFLKSFNDTVYSRPLPHLAGALISEESGLMIGSGGGSAYSRMYQVYLLSSEWPRFAERAVFEKLSSDC